MSRVLVALLAVSLGIALLVAPVFTYYTAAHLLEAIGAEPVKPLAFAVALIGGASYVFGAAVYASTHLRQQ